MSKLNVDSLRMLFLKIIGKIYGSLALVITIIEIASFTHMFRGFIDTQYIYIFIYNLYIYI